MEPKTNSPDASVDDVVHPLEDQRQLDNFDRAFSFSRTNRMTCRCGKEFYDFHNTGYDWEEGELESLDADPNAYGCDYAIDRVEFEGREYANACSCWHERASRIIQWIDGHGQEIARFLTLEKERKLADANHSPTVG